MLWRRLRLQMTDASPIRTLVASGHERLRIIRKNMPSVIMNQTLLQFMMDFQVPPCHLHIELMASSVLLSSHLVECSHARGLGSLSHG